MASLPKTLPAPERPNSIPENAKWLAGEGAGSWFAIIWKEDHFLVTRFSPSGDMECAAKMISDGELEVDADFELTYPSHCAKVTVIQNEKTISLLAV